MNVWVDPHAALPRTPQYAYVDQARASGSTQNGEFGPLEAKLNALNSLPSNWNGYGAEAPSEESIQWARLTLLLLRNQELCPSSVKASARGGTVLCFDRHPKYASLEFFNSDEIVLLMATRPGSPKARQVQHTLVSLVEALSQISEFALSA